jgi:hypothetical protein
VAHERLEVKWDYFAFPVWSVADGSCDPDIPISPALREQLQRWSDDHTDAAWGEKGPDHPDTPAASPEHYREWLARGRKLTQRLQAELGDDFEVIFGETWRSEDG